MKEYYEKAIQKIKEQKKILTEEEWNKIAKKEKLLCTESLKFISGKDFIVLQKEVRAG